MKNKRTIPGGRHRHGEQLRRARHVVENVEMTTTRRTAKGNAGRGARSEAKTTEIQRQGLMGVATRVVTSLPANQKSSTDRSGGWSRRSHATLCTRRRRRRRRAAATVVGISRLIEDNSAARPQIARGRYTGEKRKNIQIRAHCNCAPSSS